jgi:hypothetical protein
MRQHDNPRCTPTGDHGDDFQRIRGIGPVLARHLHVSGIRTYEELASRTPEEIAAVLADVARISPKRIASENWTGRARELAGSPPEPSDPRQHYAAFHLELLLESDNRLRRTKIHHHQTDARDAWPGWDEQRLLAFLRERIPLPDAGQGASPGTKPTDPQSAGRPSADARPAAEQPSFAARYELPPSFLVVDELSPIHNGQRSQLGRDDEPNHIRLTMRLNPDGTPIPGTFDFCATIAARRFGSRERLTLGTTRGSISTTEPLAVEVAGPALPPGLYRLVVAVDIYPTGHATEEPALYTSGASGDLLKIADAPSDADFASA